MHVDGSEQILKNWDELKKREKKQTTVGDTLRSVAKSLPALWRAEKIQSKAAKAGYGRTETGDALDELSGKLDGLRAAVRADEQRFEALGDLLFAVTDAARLLNVDPEDALHAACERYTGDFIRREEAGASETGKQLDD